MTVKKAKWIRIIWISVGFLSLTLGIIGIFLPLLPTTPFLLLTVYSFAKGSDKFYNWFTTTGLYRKYIKDYVFERAMYFNQKAQIFATVLIVTSAGFFLIDSIIVKVVLMVVFLIQFIYLTFFVRTKKNPTDQKNDI